ncbi:MAG TPA: glycosyltransferase family 4 protein, partial [Vicinamibacterales bacterium]|nr:glycosyltransferase family 4 protein [Vicinamibacterales bacterium]
MRILAFTGGAGTMYCGSCLRDNALATALLARGHDVVLTPVYTPTRTDEQNVSKSRVFFGGISVYLQQHAPMFRHTPRVLDRLWDSPWALRLATRRQIKVDPKNLGEMTVSMLRGERGFQEKEIGKLLDWLRSEPPFDVINLPYPLLLGLAEPLRRELKRPICCTLQGEDLFLDGLGEPYRREALDLIRRASVHVDAFLPVSEYYRDYMPAYLSVAREKMRLVPLGINREGYTPKVHMRSGPFTIGYFARIAPEKGLHALCEAYRRLRARPDLPGPARVVAAGYLADEHQAYLDQIRGQMREWKLDAEFEYRGEVDRAGKIAFLQSLDVLSVPAIYDEPKGIFLLEAMANGIPVVQPRRGAFPEIVEKTGGGLIVAADDPDALADGLLALWR